MAYLDNSQVTVDAILTKRGAELLAMGDNFFNITQYALSDDGVDYSLWNLNHTLGNNYYGELIDNMPTLEAIKDESLVMRNKLITLPRNTVRIPVINIGQNSYELQAAGQSVESHLKQLICLVEMQLMVTQQYLQILELQHCKSRLVEVLGLPHQQLLYF